MWGNHGGVVRRVTLAVFLVVSAACTSGSGSGNDGGVTDSGPSPSPTVPNVVGQTLDDAQASVTPVVTIAQKGTTLSSDDPADTIVRQTPAAGTTYDPIDGVRVRVVITVVPVQVPGVVGLSLDKAKKQLASRGLKISVWMVQSTKPKMSCWHRESTRTRRWHVALASASRWSTPTCAATR